jgi:hypothetical protein
MKMPDINVNISSKIATLTNTPVIVCGNSDYEVKFTFDAEFSAYTSKTLRVVFREKGIEKHWDIVFQGDSVFLPPVYAVNAISLGVVCGNVISSTPVVVPCHYGDTAEHDDPPPGVYEQLYDLIEHIEPAGEDLRSPILTSLKEVVSFANPPEIVDVDRVPNVHGS